MKEDWEIKWEEEARRAFDRQLQDPVSLHTALCLGTTTKVPDFVNGGLVSIEFVDFASMIYPPISCPKCHDSPERDQAFAIRSVDGQSSYLCYECHTLTQIPCFGIYSEHEDGV